MRAMGFGLAMAFAAAGALASPVNPFLGTWTVVEAKTAPWVNTAEYKPVVNAKILHATFVFTATSVTAPPPLGCTKAVYELKTVPPEFLFEGGLTDPKPQARALGFTTDTFPAMSFGCDRPDADISMDYAMVDKNTVVFALDNFIYILKRTPLR